MKQPLKEPMYQAFCEIRGGEVIPLSPVAGKDFCQKILDAMALAITMGRQPDATNPHMVRVLTSQRGPLAL